MLAFLITASIMLSAACADLRQVMGAGQRRLTVFYLTLLGASLALAALHCLGVRLGGI